ncbi:glyoxalase family protein [Purpureocillium lavendulum]|uniref:Glyoxalase family protein n=1 Tax=Purpureocillium lavendulum TaxID=1247861 RepID=A0AB34FTZ1_9HYPO|nr:glyoxalase family protein [Purpureocillium lavendulum]
MAPPPLGQIVETILYTSDVARLAQWYRDVMGLEPFFSAPAGVGFRLPGDTLLLLFDRTKVTEDRASERGVIPKHGSPTGLGQHIAFACGVDGDGKDAAMDAWEKHFEEKGVAIVGRMNWERGGRSLYVHDAEGHVIEVMTRGVWPVY